MACLMLACWLKRAPPFAGKAWDVIEMFAGTGKISRLAAASGWHALAHDMAYDRSAQAPGQHNAMDLNTSAGFMLLGLKDDECLSWFEQYTVPFPISSIPCPIRGLPSLWCSVAIAPSSLWVWNVEHTYS